MTGGYSPSLRVIELEKENHHLRKQLKKRDERIAHLEQQIQDLQMQLTQLQTLVFKKKRIPPNDPDDDVPTNPTGSMGQQTRSPSSYRRPTPLLEEITHIQDHTLDRCTHCHSIQLEAVDTRSIYVEDIPAVKKEVIHHQIHLYRCVDCGQTQSAQPLPRGSQVLLGSRVKARVLYLAYILHCSDTDIIRYLWNTYQLKISEGEIHYIQRQSAQHLRPHYNGIRDTLNQQETTHLDETGWQVGKEKQYAWGRVSPTTPEVLIQIGTRGKGNAEEILKGFSGCLTTDCYTAYKHLAGIAHQICWVHILREAKDVARSPYLTVAQQRSAQDFHQHLQVLYHDLKQQLAQPFNPDQRSVDAQNLQKRLGQINGLLSCDTPKKLKNIKLRTQEYTKELFTCLLYRAALPENNLAERSLRHLVLKRKRSFGSATAKGAGIFVVNFSVVYSVWKKFPDTFFPKLQEALVD